VGAGAREKELHVRARKRTADKTSCGREWTLDGDWFDGSTGYPFPSIQRKD